MRRMRAQADMEGKPLYAACGLSSVGRDPFLTGLGASGYRTSSGSFAIFTAIRRASSLVSILAANLRRALSFDTAGPAARVILSFAVI